MNYVTLSSLYQSISNKIHLIPKDVDVIVGIPRSGLMPANLISLMLNLPLTDLERFLEGKSYSSGFTKMHDGLSRPTSEMKHALIVDDSILSGRALRAAKDKIRSSGVDCKITYCVIYGVKERRADVDVIFEYIPHPRIFQWNFMHHAVLERSCVDIDGVLCLDPTEEHNDDGELYNTFLMQAQKILSPTRCINTLVTNRLEKYRPQTEAWLAAHNIKYQNLHMLDLPSKIERQQRGVHGSFKGGIYRDSDAELFIESELRQAIEIANISGKPVLCIENHEVIFPGYESKNLTNKSIKSISRLNRFKAKTLVRNLGRVVFGQRYGMVRNWIRSNSARH